MCKTIEAVLITLHHRFRQLTQDTEDLKQRLSCTRNQYQGDEQRQDQEQEHSDSNSLSQECGQAAKNAYGTQNNLGRRHSACPSSQHKQHQNTRCTGSREPPASTKDVMCMNHIKAVYNQVEQVAPVEHKSSLQKVLVPSPNHSSLTAEPKYGAFN